jgi:hypothetical protein
LRGGGGGLELIGKGHMKCQFEPALKGIKRQSAQRGMRDALQTGAQNCTRQAGGTCLESPSFPARHTENTHLLYDHGPDGLSQRTVLGNHPMDGRLT